MICKDCLYFDPEDAETVVCVRVDKRRMADDSPLTEECFEAPIKTEWKYEMGEGSIGFPSPEILGEFKKDMIKVRYESGQRQ